MESVVERADAAPYRAKEAGRNRNQLYEVSLEEPHASTATEGEALASPTCY